MHVNAKMIPVETVSSKNQGRGDEREQWRE
jgi:hypothetical protein